MIYVQCNVIYFVVTAVNLLHFVFSARNDLEYMKGVRKSDNPPSSFFNTLFVSNYGLDKENLMSMRMKRQVGSGAGKYVDTAKMPQVKVLRLFLQLFKNLWTDSHIGGSSPFHPNVCKPVLYLFKDQIIEFFFPDPRVEHKKKSH